MIQQDQIECHNSSEPSYKKQFNMAISNKKNDNILPIKKVEAEEILCAPTVCTIPVVASFTLMLEEPKETITVLSKLF